MEKTFFNMACIDFHYKVKLERHLQATVGIVHSRSNYTSSHLLLLVC